MCVIFERGGVGLVTWFSLFFCLPRVGVVSTVLFVVVVGYVLCCLSLLCTYVVVFVSL